MATVRLTEHGRDLAPAGDGPLEAAVRFSRGGGLPQRLPDLNGLAIRLVDADGPGRPRDLLLTSSVPGRPWALAPSIRFGVPFSSISPFRFAGEKVRLVAEISPGDRPLDALASVGHIGIAVFSVGSGPRRKLMDVTVTGTSDVPAVRYDPASAAPVLEPLGLLNWLRPPVYASSRSAAPSDAGQPAEG